MKLLVQSKKLVPMLHVLRQATMWEWVHTSIHAENVIIVTLVWRTFVKRAQHSLLMLLMWMEPLQKVVIRLTLLFTRGKFFSLFTHNPWIIQIKGAPAVKAFHCNLIYMLNNAGKFQCAKGMDFSEIFVMVADSECIFENKNNEIDYVLLA